MEDRVARATAVAGVIMTLAFMILSFIDSLVPKHIVADYIEVRSKDGTESYIIQAHPDRPHRVLIRHHTTNSMEETKIITLP